MTDQLPPPAMFPAPEPGTVEPPGSPHLSRRDRIVAMRGISIPTSIVRRFFQIDGIRMAMLMAFNLFISIIPLTIIAFSFVSRFRDRISLSQVFIEQFHLKGETARIVVGAFPKTSNVLKIASVIAVGSFAISGFDVASNFQRTFADAWNAKRIKGWRGPLRGGVWFVLVFATFAFGQLLQRGPAKYGGGAYFISIPIVAIMNYWFWQVTPRLLLDKKLDSSDLRLGAILGMVASTALWVLSLFILPGWFSWYGRGFGGVGIALALLSWTYVVSVVWVVIVVISAVMWERSATIDEVVEVADATRLKL
ncbi:MAG: YhjD/YihY/BrkB family envelope integrity protein [Ilumatobacteraceae bacterium]